MIERRDIIVPTPEQTLAAQRWENLHVRMKRDFDRSLSSPDHTTWTFYGDFNKLTYSSAWARRTFERAEKSLSRAITDSGLDDVEWKEDWKDLVEGKASPPPTVNGQGICRDGHTMLRRSNLHWLCPADGEVRWNEEIK